MQKNVQNYIGLVIVFMLWGSLYVVSSVVLKYMPTFFVMFCRFVIAFVALSVIIKIQSRGWRDGVDKEGRKTTVEKPARKYVLTMGIFGYAISVGLQLLGTKYAGSTMASLINSLNPVTISLMAIPILGEKLNAHKIVGIALAVFGVYVILGVGGGHINVFGVVLSLLSVLSWSLVSVITRQGLSDYNPLVVTRNALGIGAVVEIAFALVEHAVTGQDIIFNVPDVLGLLYLGIFCTGIAYILWNKALAELPASNCSALYPIQPLTSTAMGILFFGEVIRPPFVIGTIMIIAGVLIVLLWPAKKAHMAV